MSGDTQFRTFRGLILSSLAHLPILEEFFLTSLSPSPGSQNLHLGARWMQSPRQHPSAGLSPAPLTKPSLKRETFSPSSWLLPEFTGRLCCSHQVIQELPAELVCSILLMRERNERYINAPSSERILSSPRSNLLAVQHLGQSQQLEPLWSQAQPHAADEVTSSQDLFHLFSLRFLFPTKEQDFLNQTFPGTNDYIVWCIMTEWTRYHELVSYYRILEWPYWPVQTSWCLKGTIKILI